MGRFVYHRIDIDHCVLNILPIKFASGKNESGHGDRDIGFINFDITTELQDLIIVEPELTLRVVSIKRVILFLKKVVS